jgi:hypothetical protein
MLFVIPYTTREGAEYNRANSKAFDAALSHVFFAESVEQAKETIERDTPTA